MELWVRSQDKEIKITPNGIKQAIEGLLNENERLIRNEKHLLKTIMGLECQNQKYKNLVDKIFSRITLLKMEDITMETNKVLNELLDILKEVSE